MVNSGHWPERERAMATQGIPWTRVVVSLLLAVSGWQLAAAAGTPISEMRELKALARAHDAFVKREATVQAAHRR